MSSFADPLPWAGGFEAAEDFFNNGAIHMNSSLAEGIGSLWWKAVLGLLASWIVVFFAIFKGTKSMGIILYITIPLPFLLLLILLIKGCTLPGAAKGVQFYFGRWDWSAFTDGSIYVDAVSQIFFSLSLSQGVMQGYASNNPQSAPYISNAWIIGVANSCTSIFAGFALFSTLGYLSEETGTPIEELATPGFNLAFITYPTALSLFGKGWSQFFSVSFFATLLMLGIDSLFSLVVVIMYAATDGSSLFIHIRRATDHIIVMVHYHAIVFIVRRSVRQATDRTDDPAVVCVPPPLTATRIKTDAKRNEQNQCHEPPRRTGRWSRSGCVCSSS